MGNRRKVKCKFCKVKRKMFEEGGFYGIEKSNKPSDKGNAVIVLSEHRWDLTPRESSVLKSLASKYFASYQMLDVEQGPHWHMKLKKPFDIGGKDGKT